MKGSKIAGSLKYQHFAKVTIRPFREFPIDMLRYDRCSPHKEVDSSWIGECGHNKRELVIVVTRFSENSTADWATARWQSMGAEIESISESDTFRVHEQQEVLAKAG